MIRTIFVGLFVAVPMLFSIASPASAERAHDRSGSYGVFHKHYNACGGVYASRYRHKRPHYYGIKVKPGRYVWRKHRIRVGTLRRRGRAVPQYQWVRKRVLARPVRYRVRKHRAHGRWVTDPVVIKGRSRWGRGRCR